MGERKKKFKLMEETPLPDYIFAPMNDDRPCFLTIYLKLYIVGIVNINERK